MTYQGPPPPRSVHPHGRGLPDEEYPELPPRLPRRPSGSRRRGGRSPWFLPAIGLAVVGAVVVAVALVHGSGRGSADQQPNGMITTFMPGEIQSVPSACAVVPGAVLDQYMPGRSKPAAAQPLEGKATSQCSWSVDRPGIYRFLALSVEAYDPNGLASGNGSATEAAQDAFVQAKLAKQFPPEKSQEPKAVVTAVPGLGQEAFSADQHFMRGAFLDMVTLVARYRNVLVTVIFEARAGGRFGADPVSMLGAGAQATAQSAVTKLG